MIKLRRITPVSFGMKFIGNADLDQRNNSIIHHDPSAYLDVKFIKA